MTSMDLLQWNERDRIQSKDCGIGESVTGEEKIGKEGAGWQLKIKQSTMGGLYYFFFPKETDDNPREFYEF